MKSILDTIEKKHDFNISADVADLNLRIKNKQIQFEHARCICGGENDVLIARKDFFGIDQDSVLCMNCGLVRLNPRMTEDEYRRFYTSEEYRRCYSYGDYKKSLQKKYSYKEGNHIYDEVSRAIEISNFTNVLEFGAGGGWNLIPFIKAGAKVLGVDYGQEMVMMGKEKNIPMIQGGIEKISGKYDVIILNHVLEHSLNPIKTLKTLTNHLSSESIIYLGVPNILNFSFAQLQNAHTYSFTIDTLKAICEHAYLEPIKMGAAQKIHIFGIFKITDKSKEYNVDSGQIVLNSILKFKRNQKIKRILRSLRIEKIITSIYRRF